LEVLIKLFCMLSLFAIPSIIIFNNAHGLTTVYDKVTYFDVSSFSNIGFPEAKCSRSAILEKNNNQYANVVFKCQGKTQLTQIFDAGIVSSYDKSDLETCYLPNSVNYTTNPEMQNF